MTNNAVCPSGCNRIAHLPDTKLVLRHPLLDLSTMAQAMTKHIGGTWCSGITPAQHAGGPGFNPQRVHISLLCSLPLGCNCTVPPPDTKLVLGHPLLE